jgi:group I intron endonuclease
MSDRTCTLCPGPEVARGYCRKHYSRWHRTGDPLSGENRIPAGTAGVYSITCLANGWVYIGSSMSIRQRWTTHKSWLRNGTHNVPRLQADYDAHGVEAFSYDLVSVVVDADARYACEQEQIDTALAAGKCYNQSPNARDNTGFRYSPEQSKRLSEAMTGIPKSAEHRANLWRDREVTPEFLETMARAGRAGAGKPKPAATRAKMSATQFAGRPVLTETDVRGIKRLLADGVGGSEIGRRFGITPGAVSSIKHGRNWAHVTIGEPAELDTLF